MKNDEHEMDSVGEVRGESSNKKTFLKNRKPEENANHGFDNDSFSGTEWKDISKNTKECQNTRLNSNTAWQSSTLLHLEPLLTSEFCLTLMSVIRLIVMMHSKDEDLEDEANVLKYK